MRAQHERPARTSPRERGAVLIASVLTAASIALALWSAVSAAKAGRGLGESMRTRWVLEELLPEFEKHMKQMQQAAFDRGEINHAQLEIVHAKTERNRELLHQLGKELMTKQRVLSNTHLAGTGMSLAGKFFSTVAGGAPVVEKVVLKGYAVLLGGTGTLSRLGKKRQVGLDDVAGAMRSLQLSWQQPEDAFVRARLSAGIRGTLSAFLREHHVSRLHELKPPQRKRLVSRMRGVVTQLKEQGWAPPGGRWRDFVRSEVRAYRGDDEPAREGDLPAGSTAIHVEGALDPAFEAKARQRTLDRGETIVKFEVEPLVLEVTLDLRCRMTTPTRVVTTKRGRVTDHHKLRYVFHPAKVGGDRVSGQVDVERLEDWTSSGPSIVHATHSADHRTFEAERQANGDWLLTIRAVRGSRSFVASVWRLRPER